MNGLSLPDNTARARRLSTNELDSPRFSPPSMQEEMPRYQDRWLLPGRSLERPPFPIAWFVIVDDLAVDAAGPSSFDSATLRWLFSNAPCIFVRAIEEPCIWLYRHFVEAGPRGKCRLVIQTREIRLETWRHFARQICDPYGVFEAAPFMGERRPFPRKRAKSALIGRRVTTRLSARRLR
jgi:hypothetical protein